MLVTPDDLSKVYRNVGNVIDRACKHLVVIN